MKPAANKIDLFRYLDYRSFLRDWYAAAKLARRSFSFRAFSKKAGFHSPNFLKLVMDGERNLTAESVTKFSVGLGLNKQEQEFFQHLVVFTQAKTHEEKDAAYQRLVRSKRYRSLKPIEKQQYEFYSSWYHPVIRELITAKDCDGTPEWIAAHLFPSITVAQATKSIELLSSLGLIERTEEGKWRQSSTIISTGPEVSSLVLFNYHLNLLDLTKEALKGIDPNERDISAMTLGIERGRLPELKRKVQEFRQEVLKLVAGDEHPEEVVQLNVQLFPVTKREGKTP